MATTDIDSIYGGAKEVTEIAETQAEPEVKAEESAEPETTEPEATEPKAEETKEAKGEKEAKPKGEEKSETVPLSVYLQERDKSKQLKAQLEAKEPVAPKETPSVFDDEGKFVEHLKGEMQAELYQDRLVSSQEDAVEKYGEEKVVNSMTKLKELAGKDPQLAVRFQTSRRPFVEAVKIVEEQERIEKLSDPDYETKLEARIREKIQAELAEKQGKESELDESIPESTLETGSVQTLKTGSGKAGKTPLAKIYG